MKPGDFVEVKITTERRPRSVGGSCRQLSSPTKEINMAREVVVLSGVRTAIGDYGGALKDMAPTALGAAVIQRGGGAGQDRPGAVGHVVLGSVIHGEARDMYISRVAGDRRRAAGRHAVPHREPPLRQRPAGDRVGRAAHPARRHRLRGRRRRRVDEPRGVLPAGRRAGASAWATRTIVDAMVGALHDPFGHGHMGITAENIAAKYGIHARGAGRVRAGEPPARARARSTRATSRARSCRSR